MCIRDSIQPFWPSGRLTRINGLVMEAAGLKLPLGSSCRILPANGSPVDAEVVGFAGEKLYLMPSDDVYGLSPGAQVVACETPNTPQRLDGPTPVSYTHLDVYKRQLWYGPFLAATPTSAADAGPV